MRDRVVRRDRFPLLSSTLEGRELPFDGRIPCIHGSFSENVDELCDVALRSVHHAQLLSGHLEPWRGGAHTELEQLCEALESAASTLQHIAMQVQALHAVIERPPERLGEARPDT